MSLFVPVPRTTILIPNTGPPHDPSRAHLYVVLTKLCSDKKILTVPICSVTPKCDRTCLLGRGDHHWIKHDSYVMYAEALITEAQTLANRVNKGDVTYKGLIPDPIFALVSAGVDASRRSPQLIKKYYKDNKP